MYTQIEKKWCLPLCSYKFMHLCICIYKCMTNPPPLFFICVCSELFLCSVFLLANNFAVWFWWLRVGHSTSRSKNICMVPLSPWCVSCCILAAHFSPELRGVCVCIHIYFLNKHQTKVILWFLSKIRLEKWGYWTFDGKTELLTSLSLLEYSYSYFTLKWWAVNRVTY